MTTSQRLQSGTNLLQTALAKPYHYRRSGRYYLRLRPQGTSNGFFTLSLRTTDRTTAMNISKDILKALAVFHLDKPEATWGELREQLLVIAEDCLSTAHGRDDLIAYSMIYDEMRESLTEASARASLTVDQHRALGMGKAILKAAQERLEGRPDALIGIIDKLNHETINDSPDHPSLSLSVGTPQASPKAPLSWDTLASRYMAEHSANVKDSTKGNILTSHKVISGAFEAIGVSDLRSHTRDDMVALRGKLLETRKPSTVNALIQKLTTVMEWAVNNDYLPKAYTSKLKIAKGADSGRESFSREQVVAVMDHAKTLPVDSWERWGVSLLAITGARVGEVAQLTKEDIKEVDGHWCIDINEDGPGKSIKNKHSARLVPLVDGALGFDLKEFLKAVQAGALPSDHKVSAVKASKNLGLLIKQALGENREANQTLHSLRHHLSGSMQAAGVPVAFAQAVLGHASGTITFDTYGSGVAVKASYEAIRKSLS